MSLRGLPVEENRCVEKQFQRFIDLIFGANFLSPTKMEYGMYAAKSASLRSLDLSRQVGAAIFSADGEIILLGANEVPKGHGGTYWCDEGDIDDRDYKRREDTNEMRKAAVLADLMKALDPDANPSEVLARPGVRSSQFMDALEYGRIIHAEMSAICDVARLGRPLKDAILFCTTFPCHMCAKHIVAAGIKQVVFLEPYPKSLAPQLHGDSIEIEGQSRGDFATYPGTLFTYFHGVSPRRYRDLFERRRRKDGAGKFQEWDGERKPIFSMKLPIYLQLELDVIKALLVPSLQKAGVPLEALWEEAVS